jgi:hypothetical protein
VTLQDLGNLGEFAGGILVVVSLFYLASQIRQNTRAMQATAYHDAVRTANASSMLFVQDPSLGPLLSRGSQQLATLSESERSQFDQLIGIVVRSYAAAVELERQGFLPEGDISAGYEAYLRDVFASPSMVEWWGDHKHIFAPSFHDRMAKLLAA